jgi:hypothetical protein
MIGILGGYFLGDSEEGVYAPCLVIRVEGSILDNLVQITPARQPLLIDWPANLWLSCQLCKVLIILHTCVYSVTTQCSNI